MQNLKKNKQQNGYKMVIRYKMDVSKKHKPHQTASLVDDCDWNCYKMVSARHPQSIQSIYLWVLTKWNPQTPSLQNGLLETHRYFPGASNPNTSGTKLEHKWNTHPRSGTQLEHLPQKCKWNTSGIQVGHTWNTTGTCITRDDAICGWVLTKWNPQTPSLQNGLLEIHRYFPGASNWNTQVRTHRSLPRASGLYRMRSTRSSVCNQMLLIKWCSHYRMDFWQFHLIPTCSFTKCMLRRN